MHRKTGKQRVTRNYSVGPILKEPENRVAELLTKCLELSRKESVVLGTGEELFKRQVREMITRRKLDFRKIICLKYSNQEECKSVKLFVKDNQSVSIYSSSPLHVSRNIVRKRELVARYT